MDCLPLLEEYFDGEVTGQTEEQVTAHLAMCADCSAALDALSFEQEVYARYDRGGLEVSPDLWARVSAEVARTPLVPESTVGNRPLLTRARAYFAAALGTLAARPAFASSLALVVVAAAAGTLWLTRRTPPTPLNSTVAVNTANTTGPVFIPPAPVNNGGDNSTPPVNAPSGLNQSEAVHVVYEPREAGTRPNADEPRQGALTDMAELLGDARGPKNDGLINIGPEDHAPDDTAGIFVKTSGPSDVDVVPTNAQPLDPEQKDLARHVERAQMLLRSIKNVRASDLADSDISYEKKLSRKLLAENATLQLEAEVKGDKETQQVLDRIEPFLLDIANMGDKPTREEVRSIRERVKQNEIVAALEVY